MAPHPHSPRYGRSDALPPVRKSLGQHFLHDHRVLSRIADALQLRGDETVVEIGAGRGALTELLRERAGRVVAVEYDRALCAVLRERFAADPRVAIIEADVLTVNLGEIAGSPYVLAGNIPYYITTPILFHALHPPRPLRAIYLVQREVAERMAAAPGSKDYGALSVNLQAVAHVQVLFRVPAGAFVPPPKVESAVVRVMPRADPVVTERDQQRFRELVQSVFGMRRKQMRRVLRGLYPLSVAGAEAILREAAIVPEARPETLAPENFATLLRAVEASN